MWYPIRRFAGRNPFHNHVIRSGGIQLPDFQRARSGTRQRASVVRQKLGFGFVHFGKAGGPTPVADRLGAQPFDRLPVVVVEVSMEGFGQPAVVGLCLLQVGGLAELTGTQQPGQRKGKPGQSSPVIPSWSRRVVAWAGKLHVTRQVICGNKLRLLRQKGFCYCAKNLVYCCIT
jgi:hypothetical protein